MPGKIFIEQNVVVPEGTRLFFKRLLGENVRVNDATTSVATANV